LKAAAIEKASAGVHGSQEIRRSGDILDLKIQKFLLFS